MLSTSVTSPFGFAVGSAALAYIVPVAVGIPVLKRLPELGDAFSIGIEDAVLRALVIIAVFVPWTLVLIFAWKATLGHNRAIGAGAAAAIATLLWYAKEQS